ncbi:MAG: N-acetylmuramoyl-L-alanine amidase [Oscillatoria sp. SIO1A7]|nr:N-acetylmuramoyl-L-alanine amidase [Oscillatoria sp. SIO1A7]
MRRFRLWAIALISFIAVTGGATLKKSLSLSLCGLLGFNSLVCSANFSDDRANAAMPPASRNLTTVVAANGDANSTNRRNEALTSTPAWLPENPLPDAPPAEQPTIGDIPRIRKPQVNLNLQQTLPTDFRVSSQMPFSSGKREIVMVSPSTGKEQKYTVNLPGARFQIYEAEFKDIGAIDSSNLTGTARQVIETTELQSLSEFKLDFQNNQLSEVILADGTRGEFRQGRAVIQSPDGQPLETIEFSQAIGTDGSLAASPKSAGQQVRQQEWQTSDSAATLASSPNCSNTVGSLLGNLAGTMATQGNRLAASKTEKTRIVGLALSFASGALKNNANSRESLQEVTCEAPVQCDEKRVSGGSEIRTDLFQVPAGIDRQVTLEYEFFEIPDTIELYYDGNQLFSDGPKSSRHRRAFTLPDTAEYVGVKLTGNTNPDTEWWYVVSCSGTAIAQCHDNYAELSLNNEAIVANETQINIISREEWQARKPIKDDPNRSYEAYTEPLKSVLDTIVVHHAGDNLLERRDICIVGQEMQIVQNYHMKETNRADIGYHFGIDMVGRIYEGRDIKIKGSHVAQGNTGKIGIVLLADLDERIGDFEIEDDSITSEMENSLLLLIEHLKSKYDIEYLGGHRELNQDRQCPGTLTMERMEDWRSITKLKDPKPVN